MMKRKIITFILAIIMLMSVCSAANAAVQDWEITKGFGTVKGTGAGLSVDEENLVVGGFGEMVYRLESVEEAVAVQFKVNAFPTLTHYFYFGLVNTDRMVWEAAGTKAKGIVNRVVVSQDGNTLRGTALNTTDSGTLTVDNADSPMKAMDTIHMAVFYREGDTWTITLDGAAIARVPHSSTRLGEKSHLIAGAYSSSSMEMELQAVFVDENVTAEMKDGSYISQLAGDDSRVDVYYDDEGKLILGDTIITGGVEMPYYVVSSMDITAELWGKTLAPYLLIAAGVTGALSILVFIVSAIKKKRSRKEKPNEK